MHNHAGRMHHVRAIHGCRNAMMQTEFDSIEDCEASLEYLLRTPRTTQAAAKHSLGHMLEYKSNKLPDLPGGRQVPDLKCIFH